MWGRLLAGVFAWPWARRAAGYALVALTVTLFILNLRRTAERLENLERAHAIQRKMLEAASRRPRDRDDLLKRLREGGF